MPNPNLFGSVATHYMAVETDKNLLERLIDTGAHFAQARARRHPSMKSFVLGSKNKIDLLDLTKTEEFVGKAKEAMKRYGAEGKKVLFVAGKREMVRATRDAAESLSMPFVAGRWLGGTLTNFAEIKKRVERLVELEKMRESGELEKKYTKLERLMLSREEERLRERFGGLVGMEGLPAAVVVVDTRSEAIAVAEAKEKHIPVIGILNSDCDLSDATYPVIANDASVKTVKLLLAELIASYREGRDG